MKVILWLIFIYSVWNWEYVLYNLSPLHLLMHVLKDLWWFIIFTCCNVMLRSNVFFSFHNLTVIVIFNDVSCKFLLCKIWHFDPLLNYFVKYFVKFCAFLLYQLSLFILPIVIMWIIILKTLKVNPLQKNIIITCLMTKKWYYICHTLF